MARSNPALVALDKRLAQLDERRRAVEAEHLSVEAQITTLRAARDEAAAAVRKRAKKPTDKPVSTSEPSA